MTTPTSPTRHISEADCALVCPGCGYDLRAAEMDGEGKLRCPECGAVGTAEQMRRRSLLILPLLRRRPIAMLWPAGVFALSLMAMFMIAALIDPSTQVETELAIAVFLATCGVIYGVILVGGPVSLFCTVSRGLSGRAGAGPRGGVRLLLFVQALVLNLLIALACFVVALGAASEILGAGKTR